MPDAYVETYEVRAPRSLLLALGDLGESYGADLVAAVAADLAHQAGAVPLGRRLLDEMVELRQTMGTVRAQVTRWAREDRASEEEQMGTLDDLRTATGNVAGLVAALGAEATAAADRITNAVAALQAQVQAGAENDVAPADVAALQDVEARLRSIGEQIASLGADSSSEVPPPGEADPIEDLPGTPPTPAGTEPAPAEPGVEEPETPAEPGEEPEAPADPTGVEGTPEGTEPAPPDDSGPQAARRRR